MRKGDQEKVTAREAGHRLGMTEQAIGQWANQAPADTYEMKANRRLLKWPQFPIWYRQHLQANREKPADFDAARTRKMAAEAEMAEYELEQLRGSLVPESTLDQVLGERLDTLRSKLLALPGAVATRLVGLKTAIDSQAVLDDAVREMMVELSHGGDGDR